MESAAVKRIILDSMYQNKTEDVYPYVDVSANAIKDLLKKNHNEVFPMNVVVRVIAIEDRDTGGGKKEPYYRLELREAGVTEKQVEEMTPQEIEAKIEESA